MKIPPIRPPIRSVVLALAVLAAFCVAAASLVSYLEAGAFAAPGPATAETVLVIAPGTSLNAIANRLETEGVVRHAMWFRLAVLRRGGAEALRAGEYAIPAQASMADIYDMVLQGRTIQHRITVAEGLTSAQAVRLINADPVLIGEPVEAPPQGTLLPETYLFERGTRREEILERMRTAQQELLDMLWTTRAGELPFDTPEEAVILASIVEKETSIAEERRRIAAVFINRLRSGMRLESDPTIIYGLTGGEPLGHGLRVSEIAEPNPYNTYQIDGLPPTPICNPGSDAIAAVLDPPETDERFFVADGTGGHVFASTLNEHARNVAAWRAIERQNAVP